jgi:uncharacterized membrane protein
LDDRVEQKRSSERLVFFTDAVVAIALTLLVLPLTDLVPELVAEHGSAVEAVTASSSTCAPTAPRSCASTSADC